MNSNSKFLRALKHWAYHLFRASLQGGALAVKAFTATAVANAALPAMKIGTLDLKETGCVFAVAAAHSAWDYLSANPLPDDDESVIPLEIPEKVDAAAVSEISKPLILNEK